MKRVLFLSHTHRSGTFKVGSYHLSREFATLGFDVAHVSTPVSTLQLAIGRVDDARARAARTGPVRAADGVLDYVPVTLLPARWRWSDRMLANVLARVGFESVDYCFVDQPVMAGRISGRTTVIFRPTDVKANQREQLRAQHMMDTLADGIAATSPTVLASVENPRHVPELLLENGCETVRFTNDTRMSSRRGFIYVGSLDGRFDHEAISVLAGGLPDVPIDIYGPVVASKISYADQHPNLTFHGAIPYDDVPAAMAQAKVGLLPFTRSAANSGRSPMKLYEYLASGLNVLSSEAVRTDGATDDIAFSYSDAVSLLMSARRALESDAPRNRTMNLVQSKDWASSARRLAQFAADVSAGTAHERTTSLT